MARVTASVWDNYRVKALYPKIVFGLDAECRTSAVRRVGQMSGMLAEPSTLMHGQIWQSNTCNERYGEMQTAIHMPTWKTHKRTRILVHTRRGISERLSPVHNYKEMHVKERKLWPVKEERDIGNCTSMSSISSRWLQTPGHT